VQPSGKNEIRMRHIRQLEVAVAYQSTLLFGLLLCGVSQAQTACPPGMEEYGAGVCGYSQPEQPSPQAPEPHLPPSPSPSQQWASRWGAIATDIQNKSVGTASNLESQSQAKQAAIADCRSKGGSACTVEIVYRDGCTALAAGDTAHNAKAGTTVNAASQLAMKICTASDTRCKVYYTACSLPVRIQ
jgi:hypothetical protein